MITYSRKSAAGLCCDFWYDDIVGIVQDKRADVILWPMYVDYGAEQWETTAKAEYVERAVVLGRDVLLINSICGGHLKGGSVVSGDGCAVGGASWVHGGEIVRTCIHRFKRRVCEWIFVAARKRKSPCTRRVHKIFADAAATKIRRKYVA